MNRDFIRGTAVGIGATMLVAIACVAGVYTRYLVGKRSQIDSIALPAPALPGPIPADYEWKLRDADGSEVQLSIFKHHTLVLTILDPDCDYCMAELPSLDAAHTQLTGAGVEFACVVLNSTPAEVADFSSKNGLALPLYLSASTIPTCFPTDAIPITFVVSKDGLIVWKQNGAANWEDPKTLDFLTNLN